MLLLLATGCAASGVSGSPPLQRGSSAEPGTQTAHVVRHVDGDTVVLRGRGVGPLPAEPTRVRLLLVDTPEVSGDEECFGPEAADRTAALLPDGAQVRVEADEDVRDRFDRVLLHVWTQDGVHVGADLLRGGFATVLVVRPNERYLDELEAVEADARASGRGLWSACR